MPKKPVPPRRTGKSPSATPKTVKPRVAAPTAENPNRSGFNPGTLDSSIIALPLLRQLQQDGAPRKGAKRPKPHDIIIDLNLDFPGGRQDARKKVLERLAEVLKDLGADKEANRIRDQKSDQYLFGSLEGEVIRQLVARDRYRKDDKDRLVGAGAAEGKMKGLKKDIFRSIYKVWPDFQVRAFIDRSIRTVKADAARFSFSAEGTGMVWGVMDSGVQGDHAHFQLHGNLAVKDEDVWHKDFTGGNEPLVDAFGHGTHVAGIIAGEVKGTEHCAFVKQRDEQGEVAYSKIVFTQISGMAPKCKLVSLKVLDGEGGGQVSNLIAALDHVQEINAHGRRLRIHGVNMSLGYDFDPEWFACGQSPLCVEVDRMVRSGVVVVVAAGNTGYAYVNDAFKGPVASGMDLSINDPGNADLAITVGSTHKDSPHVYGISYFSSKGPTGDGRLKPDLVAPGEKILSCAAGRPRAEIEAETGGTCEYREHSGTSMAAPHVSGVVAAFLSVRREFIGQPEKVKEIFTNTATDLKREKYFQGNGLVDLMRAIQSV
ncbi:MAG: peptidase in kexin sedolisin [Fibrobacteres bacterium]|nr:peptidase in kexin sedolisin [Fibrobacterota bacterium]